MKRLIAFMTGTLLLLYCISSAQPAGTLAWDFNASSSIHSSAAIDSDQIVVGSDDHYLYALYPDGTKKWDFETHSKITSSPAIGSDGAVYIGSEDGHLYAITRDGRLMWSYDTGWPIRFHTFGDACKNRSAVRW
jgi:outer membrane protein assembly factor BamB